MRSDLHGVRDIIESTPAYAQDPFLHARFLQEATRFHTYDGQNVRQFGLYQWFLLLSTGLTPFLVSLQSVVPAPVNIWLKVLPLITSLVVAVLSPTFNTFGYQSRHIAYRFAYQSLISEFYKFHGHAGAYANKDDATGRALLIQQVEAIILSPYGPTPAEQGAAGVGP
jgi:hypothetical protein